MSNYQTQFNRAEKYYSRFSASEAYFDDIYTFFMHCYHIKDYLKHDSGYTSHTNQEIEEYITDTSSLALCADICNGMKHLNLTNTRSGSIPNADSGKIKLEFADSLDGTKTEIKVSCKVIIKHDGSEQDAFDVATDAMKAWRSFV